jgi:membrane-bound acyltransferase YfiQ involved in biofilm formation
MTTPSSTASEKAWTLIEQEKRRDRLLRVVSVTAWAITFVIVLLFAIMIGLQVAEMWKSFHDGMLPRWAVVSSAMPLVIVLGFLSVLIATLTTIGIFLRLRTASLTEIQLRLAALEDMLAKRLDEGS